ncbi:MAG: cobalt ECF transporter T component CbiQ [Methanomicrobiales archaeon]|nr:cobalt ECF transporter T component CbiQ [Methanomicrobiales archaeon]
MIDDLFYIEKYAYRSSFLHSLDARVKIITCFAMIIATVAFPYTTAVYVLGAAFFSFFLLLWLLSRLPVRAYLTRLLLVLPFGLFIILFQIFFPNPRYLTATPLWALPAGIVVYAESVEFASILFIKFVLCVSFILLLSLTTRMQDLLEGAGRLGLPPEFTLCIGMMIRYLFVFADMYIRIKNALETRCFDPFNRALPYRYRFRQMGYTVGMMFLRSYEQGERTYIAMLCRGYGASSSLHIGRRAIRPVEWAFLAASLCFCTGAACGIYLLA